MKFGGAAVADAAGIRRTAALVRAELPRAPVVVVSALAGVTDALLAAAEAAAAGAGEQAVAAIVARHRAVAGELAIAPRGLDDALAGLVADARALARAARVTPAARDAFLAHGERCSAQLLAAALVAEGVPAEALDAGAAGLCTDDHHGAARPRPDAARMRAAIAATAGVAVVQGFVGRTAQGAITTLGRNGSDLTAALFAQALGADEIQVWKDVPGVCVADPRLVPRARRIAAMTPASALALAACGSRIVHPGALACAAAAEIPLVVRGVASPGDPGTRIAADAPSPRGVLAIGHAGPGDEAAVEAFAALRATAAASGGGLVGLVGEPAALAEAVAPAARALAQAGVGVHAADSSPAGDAIAFAVPAAEVHRSVALLHDRFFRA